MEFTVRIPKQVLIIIGAALSVAVGALTAKLLPTTLTGYLSEPGRPTQAVHESTSLTQT